MVRRVPGVEGLVGRSTRRSDPDEYRRGWGLQILRGRRIALPRRVPIAYITMFCPLLCVALPRFASLRRLLLFVVHLRCLFQYWRVAAIFHFVKVSVSHVFPGRFFFCCIFTVRVFLFIYCVLSIIILCVFAFWACSCAVCLSVSVCLTQDVRQSALPSPSRQFDQIDHQDVQRFMSHSVVTSLTLLSTLRATADNSPECIGTVLWLASDSNSGADAGGSDDGKGWAVEVFQGVSFRHDVDASRFYYVTVSFVTIYECSPCGKI